MSEKCNAKGCGVLANNGFICQHPNHKGEFICWKCCNKCPKFNKNTQRCGYEVVK